MITLVHKTLFVTNSISGGGAERSVNLIGNGLFLAGHKVAIAPINSAVLDEIQPKCQIFSIDRVWQSGILETLAAFLRFSVIVQRWKPKTVVLNCDLPELFGALLFGKHKFVVVEHSHIPWAKHELLGRAVRGILKFRKCKFVGVSDQIRIWPNHSVPNQVIRNPVAPKVEEFDAFTSMTLRRLVFIGRLSREKNPIMALEIAKATSTDILFIGDGPLKLDLVDSARGSEIKVNFTGWLEKPWSELHNGDLLLVPSLTEGDGLIAIEALQRGIPLLLSKIPSFESFLLPELNYCADLGSFIQRINTFSETLTELVAPADISDKILQTRSLDKILVEWASFLHDIN